MPQIKQGGITVDAAHEMDIPVSHQAALERSHRMDKEVYSAREARHERLTAIKPEQPSANPLPILKGLKMANNVHDVFKKR